jgi:cytochrome c553
MFKNLLSTLSGAVAIFAMVAVPANAADEIDASKVAICGSCHGLNGEPTNPATIPPIWGQQPSYLFKQLHDFRSGDRENPIMAAMAKTIAQEDMRKVANYFAAKTWPANKAAAAAPAAPSEEKIGVCKACHQAKFEGGPPAPRLAGLSYEYLLAAMNGFADGSRTNNLDMPTLMKALTPADRDAIAKYLAAM